MNYMDIVKTIKHIFIFIFFVVSPFIFFLCFMYRLSDDGVFGMIIRFINTVMLPVEIIIVITLNIIGYFILSKNKIWNIITLIYFFVQSLISVILVIIFCKKGINIVGESLLANDIINGVSYYRHSVITMCVFNILLFFIVAVICTLKKLIGDNKVDKNNFS